MKFFITLVVFLGISLGASAAGCVSQVPGLCQASKWQQTDTPRYEKKFFHQKQFKAVKRGFKAVKQRDHRKVFKKGYKAPKKFIKAQNKPVNEVPIRRVGKASRYNVSTEVTSIGNEITGAPSVESNLAIGLSENKPGLFTRMYYQASWAVVHIYYGIRWLWLLL